MPDMLKTRPCVKRAQSEGFQISEYALRQWLRTGAIPARKVGSAFLIYYPNLVKFLQCVDGADNQPAAAAVVPGIRRVEVGR